MSAPRRYRAAGAVLATAVILPTALVGVGAATAQSSTATAAAVQPGPGDHRGPDLAALAAKLGVTEAQLKTALDATRPAGAKPGGDHGAGFATDIAGALAVSTAKVHAILDANRPAQPPSPGTKPNISGLVGALSSGLGIDKATVQTALARLQAAHEADHAARETAMATALAKQLNLDVAKVKQALAELRPAGAK
jgi:hypothetical protein